MTDRTADVTLQVRELFDTKASGWQSKYAPNGPLAGRLTRLADSVAYHVPAGGNVLDLGCGTGELTRTLAASGMQATGCDISPEMLRIAADADSGNVVDWVELEPDWQVLPFRAGAFDAVIASSVLEYVDEPVTVLRECHRILRQGGVVLCTVPNTRHPVRWLEWLLGLTGRLPMVRTAGLRWPKLDGYLTYLRISRHRHFACWWHAAASQAGLPCLPDSAGRSSLRLLTFQRPDEGGRQ